MKKLIIYAICLFVLPAYSQSSKLKIKPEELSQFKAIKNGKTFFSTRQATEYAHNKKTFLWSPNDLQWQLYTESNYEYNSQGLITKEIILDNNGNANARISKSYDSKNQLLSELTENLIDNSWVPSTRTVMNYNADGRVILEERSEYINNNWLKIYGFKLEADTLNASKEIVTQKMFDTNLGIYVNTGKEIISKENGLNSEVVFMTWDGSSWQNISAEAYDYNDKAEIASIIRVKWVNGQWENEEMMYNIVWKNHLLMEPYSFEMKTWNNNSWSNEARVEYIYSKNGGITSIGYVFDDNQWKFQYRFIDEFDNFKNRSSLKMEVFEQNSWVVYFENKFINNYDSQNRLIETISQMYDGNTWNDVSKEVYGDYRVSTGINNEKSFAVNVYPNPTTDIINFNLDEKQGMAKLMITDLSGRVVLENEIDLSNTNSVNVQELNNAFYILNIMVADKKYHQKFIKK